MQFGPEPHCQDQSLVDKLLDIVKIHASQLDPEDEFEKVEFTEAQHMVTVLEQMFDALDETAFARSAQRSHWNKQNPCTSITTSISSLFFVEGPCDD